MSNLTEKWEYTLVKHPPKKLNSEKREGEKEIRKKTKREMNASLKCMYEKGKEEEEKIKKSKEKTVKAEHEPP